jgi:hypothetical protein
VVNITDCRFAPDGRSLVSIVGLQRVRLSHIALESEGFGLLTAEAEPILDRPSAGQRRAEDDDDDNDDEKKLLPDSNDSKEIKRERKRLPSSSPSNDENNNNTLSAAGMSGGVELNQAEIEHKLQTELAAQIRSLLDLFASESRTCMFSTTSSPSNSISRRLTFFLLLALTRLQSIHGPVPVCTFDELAQILPSFLDAMDILDCSSG